MMERKRECRELHEICSRLGNLGRRLRFPVYLGKELLETPIEELELSVRSFNCLRRAGMATVGDLVQNIDTREDLLKIRNLCWVFAARWKLLGPLDCSLPSLADLLLTSAESWLVGAC